MKFNPLNMMGNGPMGLLMRAAQGGGNPMQVLPQMAQSNPQMRQGVQIIQGKDEQQLEKTARSMAQERGVDINQILSSLGIEP